MTYFDWPSFFLGAVAVIAGFGLLALNSFWSPAIRRRGKTAHWLVGFGVNGVGVSFIGAGSPSLALPPPRRGLALSRAPAAESRLGAPALDRIRRRRRRDGSLSRERGARRPSSCSLPLLGRARRLRPLLDRETPPGARAFVSFDRPRRALAVDPLPGPSSSLGLGLVRLLVDRGDPRARSRLLRSLSRILSRDSPNVPLARAAHRLGARPRGAP